MYLEYNSTSIKTGTVLGVTEMPELRLTPIQGLNAKGEIDNGIELNLSVTATGNEEALMQIEDVVLYGNGIEISSSIFQFHSHTRPHLQFASMLLRFQWQ